MFQSQNIYIYVPVQPLFHFFILQAAGTVHENIIREKHLSRSLRLYSISDPQNYFPQNFFQRYALGQLIANYFSAKIYGYTVGWEGLVGVDIENLAQYGELTFDS